MQKETGEAARGVGKQAHNKESHHDDQEVKNIR